MNVIELVPGDFQKALNSEKPLRVKFGIDPTRERIHLGHFVPLRLARMFQEKGHHLDLVLGTMTGMMGDPSGQDKTRPLLDQQKVRENAESLLKQIEKVLLPGFSVHWNHKWFESMNVMDFMVQAVAKFNLSRLLSRDGFRKRTAEGGAIGMHELLVPILQGWDSVMLQSNVEIGGTDQLFNFQVTRELQEADGQKPETLVMTPVINGTDGRKMSKSFGNVIWLDETPEDMFGQIMSISDEVCDEWQGVLCDLWVAPDTHPMTKKLFVAWDIVRQIHGEEAAERAKKHFDSLVRRKETPDESTMPILTAKPLLDLVVEVRGCSRSQARRLLDGRGVWFGDEPVTDAEWVPPEGALMRIGKRQFFKVGGTV